MSAILLNQAIRNLPVKPDNGNRGYAYLFTAHRAAHRDNQCNLYFCNNIESIDGACTFRITIDNEVTIVRAPEYEIERYK